MDVVRYPLTGFSPQDRPRHRLDEAFEAAGARPDDTIEMPASTAACALALCGNAVAAIDPPVVDSYVKRGLMMRPPVPGICFRAFLVFRPDEQRSRLVRDFNAALRAAPAARGT